MTLLFKLIESRLHAKLTLGTDETGTEPFLAKLEWRARDGNHHLEVGRGRTPELALEQLEDMLINRFG